MSQPKNNSHTVSCCCHDDETPEGAQNQQKESNSHDHHNPLKDTVSIFTPAIISAILLGFGLVADHFFTLPWFKDSVRLVWYLIAYVPVGFPVLKAALRSIKKGDVFSEFFLMGIATIGAFAIREYPEGVAVMLFYSVGELFQGMAVGKAKSNIKALLDARPDQVQVLREGAWVLIPAAQVHVGEHIRLKPGEKLALDGTLLSDYASFDTAALTGESVPRQKVRNEVVLAGMINVNTPAEVLVATDYENSKLSKILELVQEATKSKAPTELFIRKFSKVYTPAVVLLAVLICLVPALFVAEYHFSDWLYKALIFLVISCPCALVVSIPLGYFGGIGAASKNGILFKGGNFLDRMAKLKCLVMDKTGTLTEGSFEVRTTFIAEGFTQDAVLKEVYSLVQHSSHPVSMAIARHLSSLNTDIPEIKKVEEVPGYGLKGVVNGKSMLLGNLRWLQNNEIDFNPDLLHSDQSVSAIAVDGKYAGHFTISDVLKTDAALAVESVRGMNIETAILSGDKSEVVQRVAKELKIDLAYGDLLPEDKVAKLKEIKLKYTDVAFVGDGVNDAPVLAVSDVGIAMGGLGSDAAIETADVVIQDDKPSKIPIAIRIGKKTKQIVWQNIGMAFGVKAIVLLLGALGYATMWAAVFADVGVALLAILNAVRIQRMRWS